MPKSYIQRRSQLQESRIARDIGGRTRAGSGNQPGAKGDVRKQGELKVEAKFTSAKSYSLKLAEIQKIQAESMMEGMENWAMQIEFVGQGGVSKKVAVIDWQTFLDLREGTEE